MTGRTGVQGALRVNLFGLPRHNQNTSARISGRQIFDPPDTGHGLPGTVQSVEHRAGVFGSVRQHHGNRARRRKPDTACRARRLRPVPLR